MTRQGSHYPPAMLLRNADAESAGGRLLLVRHASSVPPTPGGPDEHERPLTDAGLRQAEELVDLLTAHAPSRVLSSPYLRAVQTVSPTAAALGVTVETLPALQEWRSGIGPTPSWHAHYRESWERPDWSVTGGETHSALQERAVQALADIAAESPGRAVVGSHGTWIARALLGLGCAVDADFWLGMPMPAVYEVDLAGRRPTVSGPGLP